MAERQVTAEGRTIPLPRPFMVIATENPIEFAGTYRLPEAQLDRFMLRISMGYPDKREEAQMLEKQLAGETVAALEPVVSREELLAMCGETASVTVSEAIRKYLVALTDATRHARSLSLGASPRATLALARAAQAWAYLDGRNYVNPEDVLAVVSPVLAHRLVLSLDASLRNASVDAVLDECVKSVAVPPVFPR
jgi:MoxR-like ATPase